MDPAELPILLSRPAPHSPIRAITAAQFARLHHQYSLSDIDDTVLFPFLHGIDGQNQAQSLFFTAKGPVKIPDYRGLICVICDEQKSSHDMDDDDEYEDDSSSSDSSNGGDDNSQQLDEIMDIDVLDHDGHTSYIAHEFVSAPNPHPTSDEPLPDAGSLDPNNQVKRKLSSSSSSSSSSDSGSSSPVSTSTTATDFYICSSPSAVSLSLSCPTPCSPTTTSLPPLTLLPPSRPASLLSGALYPSEILTSSPTGPVFYNPRIPDGISLRNFGIQVPIYATLSDIVIYSPAGPTRSAFALAEKFKQAIEAKALERNKGVALSPNEPSENVPVIYNVYVVMDPFETFEREYPHLVQINSGGQPVSKLNFAEREREEMRQLTKASEFSENCWMGNSGDLPSFVVPSLGEPSPFDSMGNPNGYDICIECRDDSFFPSIANIRQATDHINMLEQAWAEKVAAEPVSQSPQQRPIQLPPRPAPNANSIIHLSFPSSPSCSHNTLTQLFPLLEFISSYAHSYATNPSANPTPPLYPANPTDPPRCSLSRPLKVLLHCQDGYTESSFLALSYIMYERRCTLAEAYVNLHVDRSRGFFVYQGDLNVLKKVEAKITCLKRAWREKYASPTLSLACLDEREGERERECSSASLSSSRWKTWGLGGSWRSSTLLAPSATHPSLSSSMPTLGHSSSHHPAKRARASTGPATPNSPTVPERVRTFFDHPGFDGSFPSRILPFLYLGNLNHASNVMMHQALGITHVVSVGECALLPALTSEKRPLGDSVCMEEKICQGGIKFLDIKAILDDGIDSLRHKIAPIVEWIERARLEGGKILVHCRVGVSRSATVTIAYCMYHLNMSLANAYLMVRSRRLSVLIQPNMRIMYNLLGWEAELARRRAIANGTPNGEPPLGHGRPLSWPFLAREIHLLNEKYLS